MDAVKAQVWAEALKACKLLVARKGTPEHARVEEVYRRKLIPAQFKYTREFNPTVYGWNALVYLRTGSTFIKKDDPAYAGIRAEWDAMSPDQMEKIQQDLQTLLNSLSKV